MDAVVGRAMAPWLRQLVLAFAALALVMAIVDSSA
jgi:hypothetical protein